MRNVIAKNPGPRSSRLVKVIERMMKNRGGTFSDSFAVLSSSRASMSPEDRKAAHQGLLIQLRKWGLHPTPVKGHGQEGLGTSVEEPSIVVHKISLDQCKKIWLDYDQWGIVYLGPETNFRPHLLASEKQQLPEDAPGEPTGPYEDIVMELGAPRLVTPGKKRKPKNWTEIPDEETPGFGIHMPVKRPARLPGWKSPRKP